MQRTEVTVGNMQRIAAPLASPLIRAWPEAIK